MAQQGRRSKSGSHSPRRWFDVLGTGAGKVVAAIVAVGAVAAAIGQVTGLFEGPPELSADVQQVSVGTMSLDEYVRRHDPTALAPSGRPTVRLAAYSLAQATTTPVDPSAGDENAAGAGDETGNGNSGDSDGTDGTPSGDADSEGTTTEEGPSSTTPDDTSPDDTTTDGGEPASEIGAVLRERLHEGMAGALTDPALSELSIPAPCVDDPAAVLCGGQTLRYMVTTEEEHGPDSGDSPEAIQRRIVSIFRQTRTGEPDQAGKRPLMGVDVNFRISMTGFEGRSAVVHWSLHHVDGAGGAVPEAWFDRRVLEVEAEADKDMASPEFWVPLPRHEGPFVVRVSVYHGDTRLVAQDSPPIG